MFNDTDYRAGDQVRVEDGERSPFLGVIVRQNPGNAAEYEVRSNGKEWFVHWAYIRRLS